MIYEKEQMFRRIFEVEKLLSKIHDADVLLERILFEARKIVNADAGSIYTCENNILRIRFAQNDTKQKELLPGQKLPFTFFTFKADEHSISGYTVVSGKILNIPDAYAIKNMPFEFNTDPDRISGYKTKSILTVPLQTADHKMLGVMQIINALDKNGTIIPFNKDAEIVIEHFAVSATQALERAFLTRSLIMRIIKMSGFRDPKETGPHVHRVANYSVEMYDYWAAQHKINNTESEKFRDTLMIAAMLHDVGKVSVSDDILKAPRRLTEEEFKQIQKHTLKGSQLFEDTHSEIDKMARDVALRHHERWDGMGYPGIIDLENDGKELEIDPRTNKNRGLKETEIPLAARIVSIADVFDALSSRRAYKEAWSEDEVITEMQKQAGKQFDPELVDVFIKVLPRLREIQKAWSESK